MIEATLIIAALGLLVMLLDNTRLRKRANRAEQAFTDLVRTV